MSSRSGRDRLLPPGAGASLGLALPVLGASLFLPWSGQWVCAVVVIVALGVPHGALDVEIGRTLLRHRVGWAWFPTFAAPYLALVAVVLLAWRLAPEATLAAFLAVSVWHFGTEETGGGGLATLAHGGIPVAVPVLVQPAETAHVLTAISALGLTAPPGWLVGASLSWVLLATLWTARTLRSGRARGLLLPFAACIAFAVLPPLTAFTLYFVAVHAPAHTAALIRHPTRAPRVRNAAAAWRRALPTTVLTVLIGAALWPLGTGEPAVRLVGVTLRLLAALTLPHMLLDAWLDRVEQRIRARAAPSFPPSQIARDGRATPTSLIPLAGGRQVFDA